VALQAVSEALALGCKRFNLSIAMSRSILRDFVCDRDHEPSEVEEAGNVGGESYGTERIHLGT